MAAQNISPVGSTVFVSGSSTATNTYVPSLQPTNRWHIVNGGTTPVSVRFGSNLSSVVTAVFPSAGSPQLGTIVPAGNDNVVILPQALNGLITGSPATPFTSNVQISVIYAAGQTGNVFVTPVI